MNVFILAVCANLLTLVNAGDKINFSTILEILKPKQKQADYSNIEETNYPVEAVPIIPGYYLQNPIDLTKSLFENPKTDVLLSKDDIPRNEATRQSKTKKSATAKNSYLNGKILKAVRNLKKSRESKKRKNNKFKKYRVSTNTRKDLVIKMLGRMFRGLKDMHFRGKKMNKKPQFRAAEPSDAKVLGHLLKKLLVGSTHPEKHAYHRTEEQSQEDGDFLEEIVNAVQNNNQVLEAPGSEPPQRQPTMIIISTKPLHDNELEKENNAKESMEEFGEEYDGSDPLNRYQTRRAEIGDSSSGSSSSSSDVQSSSYERNPGNPFTVHKNKYKQNWPYNHYMDGDHMNINPMGPQFGSMGPTGPELFFGRKWWYFNQDDYKPMG